MNEKLAKLAYQFANLIDDKEIDRRWDDLDNKGRWFDFAEEAIPLISAEARKEAIDMLKNYGISITNEGILVPYSDEWDYLHDGPRRVLLRGNDKGEACNKFWQTLALKEGGKEAE